MYNIEYINFNNADKKNVPEANKIAAAISNKALAGDPYYKALKGDNVLFADNKDSYTQHIQQIRKNFTDIVVIAMGGATLNPQAVISLVGNHDKEAPAIHYLDNTDPYYFLELQQKITLNSTAFLVISNSGQTLETISLFAVVLETLKQHNIKNDPNRFFVITDPDDGLLQNIAKKIGAVILPHEKNISGRFSGLTNVTTFLSAIAGINVESYLAGANEAIANFHQNKEYSKPAKSAIALYNTAKPMVVNLGYLQRFNPFLEWYSQIIAESLGKEGKGYTPIRGVGPNDQHSMLQLYLEGTRDKLFTLFYTDKLPKFCHAIKTTSNPEFDYIADKELSLINAANFQATIHALKANNLPIRKFLLNDLSAKSVGALIAHSMIEVIFLGNILNINPFDQPGVELIKTNSKKYLTLDFGI
ncbi:MAG: hypothetical protein HRU35_07285 [Rickettsiaceae bacterium]|nr:hypothetical protein [Rickettsiaceae bacterium]